MQETEVKPITCECKDEPRWVAEYHAVVRQRVTMLGIDAAGRAVTDYSDPAEIVEEGPTEQYRCRGCDKVVVVTVGGHVKMEGLLA